MNPRQISMVVLFLVACGSAAWAANLHIKGNVDVQGDGSTLSPGNLSVNGSVQAPKFFCTYTKTLAATQLTATVTMGTWDFCYLSNVLIAGEDDKGSDSAQCQIVAPTGQQTGRPSWTMIVASGSWTIDKLECSATCMSFSPTRTGNVC